MTQSNNPASDTPTFCSGGRSWTRLVFLLAILLLFAAPTLKGMYYRFRPVPADGIAWRTDLRAALAESAQTGKPVLVDFSAVWCPPCQMMKYEVWPDPQVSKTVNEHFIPVALDADAPESEGPAQQYGMHTMPTLLVLDSQGQILRQAHVLNVSELLDFLARKAAQ